jgi:hypothetical protein
MTFYEALSFINTNMDHIAAVLPEIKMSDLFTGSNWRALSGAIMCFPKFTLKIQGDCIFLQDLYHEYLVTTKELENLTENEIAHHWRIALDERMHNTTDGTLAKLAFFLSLRDFVGFNHNYRMSTRQIPYTGLRKHFDLPEFR